MAAAFPWHPCDETPDAARPRVVRASAPVRVCDLGGWTDTWFSGHGRVLSLAVGPGVDVAVTVVASGTFETPVVLDAVTLGERYGLVPGHPLTGRQPLLEQAIASVALPSGCDLEITIMSSVPPGSSLGTSAAVTVALLGALDALTPGRLRAGALARAAHRVEHGLVGRQCGIQDQIAAAYGGIPWIEMDAFPEARVTRLALDPVVRQALAQRLVVVALEQSHDSAAVHEAVIARLEGTGPASPELAALRAAAEAGRDALLGGDLEAFGRAMESNTGAQAALHPDLVSPEAGRLIEIGRRHGAIGAKVNGAGGPGGSIAFLFGPLAPIASGGPAGSGGPGGSVGSAGSVSRPGEPLSDGSDRRSECERAFVQAGGRVLPLSLAEWGVTIRGEAGPAG